MASRSSCGSAIHDFKLGHYRGPGFLDNEQSGVYTASDERRIVQKPSLNDSFGANALVRRYRLCAGELC
jgi:hypothetical protein